MQEIIKEYGSVILTVIAILALAALIKVLMDVEDGAIMEGFVEVMEKFLKMAQDLAGVTVTSSTSGAALGGN